MSDDFRTFRVHVDEHVAQVVITGTGTGNAMGGLLWSELPALVAALDEDRRVHAVVLRGAGDCFSVGLDLRWYLVHYRRLVRHGDGLPEVRRQLLAEAVSMQDAITAVTCSRLPWIAAVHGPCVGAGLDLVAACDIRLAAADAYFSLREVRLGIVADLGGLQRLPHIIGAAATRELALTGRDVAATEALSLGLVTRTQADRTALWKDAAAVANEIAAHAPDAVAGIKAVLEHTVDLPVAEGLRHVAVWNAAFLPSPQRQDAFAAALAAEVPPSA